MHCTDVKLAVGLGVDGVPFFLSPEFREKLSHVLVMLVQRPHPVAGVPHRQGLSVRGSVFTVTRERKVETAHLDQVTTGRKARRCKSKIELIGFNRDMEDTINRWTSACTLRHLSIEHSVF